MTNRLPHLSPVHGLLAALCLTVTATSVFAQGHPEPSDKLDPVLQVRSTQLAGRSRVIVQFRDQTDVRAITERRGRLGRQLAGQQAQVAEVDNYTLDQLARDPRVARVMADRPAFAMMERTGAGMGAVLARDELGVSGRGIGIAVIDSGITAWHDDLHQRGGRRVAHFRDFTGGFASNVLTSPAANDPYGHGTHVAGIIAGDGYDSDGARTGIAPGAHLVSLKVLDEEGQGHISDVISAIDYAIAVRQTYNIRVINLSVGAGVYESFRTDPLAQAARRAVDAGIVVVAAAGNLGQAEDGEKQWGGITAPGNAPWVLTVGASSHQGTVRRSDDSLTGFSSRGPTAIDLLAKPDLVAPGLGIESLSNPGSTLYATHGAYLLAGTQPTTYLPYLSLSGTSMAAPVVSGAVALMLEANPQLTPNAVKALLQYTAQVLPDAHPLEQGAGLVNVAGAVRMARFFANPRSERPEPMADTIEGESVAWARHIIWGNTVVNAGMLLPGSNAWSQALMWGAAGTAAGAPVVWGVRSRDNIVWSTSGFDNIVWSTSGKNRNLVWRTTGFDNIVWSTAGRRNIVWSTSAFDNIVWSTHGFDNIVWSTSGLDNIVWSTAGHRNTVWRAHTFDNIVWSTSGLDNIVWSTSGLDNIVWSTADSHNIVWSTSGFDNIVWSTSAFDNIVWSTSGLDNIVWSTNGFDNIVWSTNAFDNIVWSTGIVEGRVWPSGR